MPRNRTIPDEFVLDEALKIVHENGPAELSFGTLAKRVDLAPSTIVQRFGTKAALLRAALGIAWDRLDAATAAADASAPDGPGGVIELLVALSGDYDALDYADQLRVLREDLRDPELRLRGAAWIATLEEAIERRLDGRGGRRPGEVAGLGQLVVAQWQGSVTVWSFTRPGPLNDFVDTSLRAVLTALGFRPRRR